ncbi:MAG: D-glycerate dehydrogenase [Nitrospirota bacterium]
MKPSVFVTRALPDVVTAALRARFQLEVNRRDRPLSREELLRGMTLADGMIAMLSDAIDGRMIESAPRLRIIANYAVGYNNIDLEAANRRGIAVTNTPGVLTETTADLAWALILAAARRLPEGEKLARSGRWTGWAPTQLIGGDVHGKTLGIIGMGRIGQAVARRAHGFSMTVLYYQRHRLAAPAERRLRVQYCSLTPLLRRSDFVSLHLPLNDASRHLIDRKALRLMKPTAYLINTARGPVVDESALIEALERKQIAGAGFDVYEREPHIPARLRRLKNVVLLPHLGSSSVETRQRMGMMVLDNLAAFFAGQRPPNQVN